MSNNGGVYHVWPDDTWCRGKDLEEYLTFKSDDYLTLVTIGEFDECTMPSYSDMAIGHLRQLWGYP